MTEVTEDLALSIPSLRRQRVAQQIVDLIKDKPLKYGERDCAIMLRMAAVGLGHANPLRGSRKYLGEVGAIRTLHAALTAAGLQDDAGIAALVDAQFQRKPAAAAMACDLVGLPGPAPWGHALGLALGGGKVLAFADNGEGREVGTIGDLAPVAKLKHPDTGLPVVIPCWNLEPCPL